MGSTKTEERNPRTRGLDRKSTLEILRVLNREDRSVAEAVRHTLPQIARAVDQIVKSMRGGGRLFYVGAGTSGRLAVLDAAEIAPTYGTSPKLVQALIAGGSKALQTAVEGAEDSATNGARDLARARVTRRDVVVGIAASGTTPYVVGALQWAKRRGCATVAVTSNPKSPVARTARIAITPRTGPEAIAGSTRMKAGTSQKMVLNMLSTTSMVRFGRVYENWMIHVGLINQKLRRRAAIILQEAASVDAFRAEHALRQTGHDLAAALVMLKTDATVAAAKHALSMTGGDVRKALELHGKKRRVSVRDRGK
ncbi:MAG: N-acetylmuramic acid 6-phosphate etherase [Candidatus Acidiferrales bacterium]